MTDIDPRLAAFLAGQTLDDIDRAHAPKRSRRDHPLAGRGGRVSERRATLYDRIGQRPEGHPCAGCGRPVWWVIRVDRHGPPDELQVLVIDTDRPDTDPTNLAPACSRCVGLAAEMRRQAT